MGEITVLEPRTSRYPNPVLINIGLVFSSGCRKNQSSGDVSSASALKYDGTPVSPDGCFSTRDAALKRAGGAVLVRTKNDFPSVPENL